MKTAAELMSLIARSSEYRIDSRVLTQWHTLLDQLVENVRAEERRSLIKRGMGEPPVSEERLQDIKETWGFSAEGSMELLMLVDHLRARIAFLCSDNPVWVDGYEAGKRDAEVMV